jgi:hypothetical protein
MWDNLGGSVEQNIDRFSRVLVGFLNDCRDAPAGRPDGSMPSTRGLTIRRN